jgi:hypothetical protein
VGGREIDAGGVLVVAERLDQSEVSQGERASIAISLAMLSR